MGVPSASALTPTQNTQPASACCLDLLRDRGLRMPVDGSWIAATAIALQSPIVTQDEDYVDVAGLEVLRV